MQQYSFSIDVCTVISQLYLQWASTAFSLCGDKASPEVYKPRNLHCHRHFKSPCTMYPLFRLLWTLKTPALIPMPFTLASCSNTQYYGVDEWWFFDLRYQGEVSPFEERPLVVSLFFDSICLCSKGVVSEFNVDRTLPTHECFFLCPTFEWTCFHLGGVQNSQQHEFYKDGRVGIDKVIFTSFGISWATRWNDSLCSWGASTGKAKPMDVEVYHSNH